MIMIVLSIIGQYILAIIYALEAKEAVSKQAGPYRWIKFSLAALMYISLGTLLSWLLFTQPIKPR